jgi:hypothetical protein
MMVDESKLRELIAKWRGHWAVAEDQGADRESRSLGCGIEHCADELEALLNKSSAEQPKEQ